MKKNIRFVLMDSILETWLLKQLIKEPSKSPHNEQLLEGIQDLLSQQIDGLLLSPYKQEDIDFNPDEIKVGELEIYPKSRKVIMAKSPINLTPKEFDILYFLAQNRGEVFTKEQIYKAVWDDEYLLDDSNIMAFIRKLRKKIEPNPDAPQYILTIWGIGYTFNDQI